MTPIEALQKGIVSLGLASACYVGTRPEGAAYPCAVVRQYGGLPDGAGALQNLSVQVNWYGADAAAVAASAQAGFEALHRRTEWDLDGWTAVGVVAVQEPEDLGEVPYQGATLHRWAVNVRVRVRKDGA